MIDWGDGKYESTATELEPVARRLIETAGVEPGQTVLDLGCGTGNVALLAAALRARVTAVDPAPRLLRVTRERARALGHELKVLEGRAEAIPVESGSFQLVLSNFGIIFAQDAHAAMNDVRRVLRPAGRLVFNAWLAAGPVSAALGEFGRAMEGASSAPPSPPQFPWRDPEALRNLVGGYFGQVTISPHEAVFEASSAERFIDAFIEEHPMGRRYAERLGTAGTLSDTRRRAIDVIASSSGGSSTIRVMSPYVVISAMK